MISRTAEEAEVKDYVEADGVTRRNVVLMLPGDKKFLALNEKELLLLLEKVRAS